MKSGGSAFAEVQCNWLAFESSLLAAGMANRKTRIEGPDWLGGYGNISGTSDDGSLTQVGTMVMREEIIVRYLLKAKLHISQIIRHMA